MINNYFVRSQLIKRAIDTNGRGDPNRLPKLKTEPPITGKSVRDIRKVTSPVQNYDASSVGSYENWICPEYNLSEIGRIEDVESYVARSFEKKIALMFKEGWHLKGKNKQTVRYVKERLEQIAQAGGTPTEEFLRQIGTGLIKKSNSVFVKARNIRASGGKVRQLPGSSRQLKPVAAYFALPGETAEYKRNSTNKKIIKWRQRFQDGHLGNEFSPENVVHFYFNKKEGFTFGTPTLVPVIDDIRALRKIEENIEALVYQHIFPIFQYKIGTPEHPPSIVEATGEDEIMYMKREIQNAPSEGGFVTPYHHEIKLIGAEGRSLKADGYLNYFRERIIAGLGVSGVDFGLGYTTNRATASTMSQNLIDSVKDFQRVFETQFNEMVVKELLLESNFNFDVLDDENFVRLKFFEIDLDAQVKMENHFADLFAKHVLNQDEVRIELGRDPFDIPSNRESEGDDYLDEKYPAYYRTFWKLIEEPKLMIQSIDEPYSIFAKAIATKNAADITKGNVEQAKQETEARQAAEAKVKQSTAASKVQGATKTTKDFVVDDLMSDLKRYLLNKVALMSESNTSFDEQWFGKLVDSGFEEVIRKMSSQSSLMFNSGYQSINDMRFLEISKWTTRKAQSRKLLDARLERFINKLKSDLVARLKKEKVTSFDGANDSLGDIRDAIDTSVDSIQFRARFIEDVEPRKAYNLGIVSAMSDNSTEAFGINAGDGCNTCQQAAGRSYDTDVKDLAMLPPFHANCQCEIKAIETKPVASSDEVEDATKMERCVLSVKADLRKRHPDWSEKQIKSASIAICNKQLKE